jgi:VWFA-related protein
LRRSLNTLLLCCLLTQHVGAQQSSPLPQTPSQTTRQTPSQTPDQAKPTPVIKEPKTVDEQDVVRITTNLVQIDAVVTDKSGKRIVDLKPDEVEIYEDGQARAITNFSYINLNSNSPTPTPEQQKTNVVGAPLIPRQLRPDQIRRTIALVVDDLGLSFESAVHVRKSLKKFLEEQLQPDDLVAIIRTSGGIGALQSFTTDRRQLYAAVEKVKWNLIGRSEISAKPFISTAGTMTREEAGGRGSVLKEEMEVEKRLSQLRQDMFTVGTLGALHYVIKGLQSLPGRKSVILFSDGIAIPRGDAYEDARVPNVLRELTDFANRASVVLYAVDARGLQTLGLTAGDATSGFTPAQVEERLEGRKTSLMDTQNGLAFLSEETGGIAILNSNDLNRGIKRILEDQQGYYLIGYKPNESTFAIVNGQSKLHHLRVTIKRSGEYNVRTRGSFYGRTEEAKTESLTPNQQLGNALTSPFSAADIQLKLTSTFANNKSAGSILQSFLHVKASDLTFSTEPDGSRKATFDIGAVTFGDNGKIVEQFAYHPTVSVAASDYERVNKNGFVYSLTIPIKKAGAYQLRMAVRDAASNRIGAASQFVEIPDLSKNRLTVSGILLTGIPLETFRKTSPVQSAGEKPDGANLQADPNANPALRLFKTDHALVYAFNIYNARLDKKTGKPQLKTQLRIYRDGKLIFVGSEEAFSPLDQTDPKRLLGAGVVQMGSRMVPGEYVIQIVVTDLLAKQKENVTSQWIDFDIVE